ncbi:MAG: hypothetical protein HRT89_01190 [Lentisphaeria bacterium]|nr:hypothetical protein [Lentisphaeria bacterium]NQZ66659.1 hypothetical protein [Lentisphaeria bacterium]
MKYRYITAFLVLTAFFMACQNREKEAKTPLGLANFHQLNSQVYSGSSPKTEADFKALADLGIRSIISVDGAHPKLIPAKKYGMKYAHVPVDYSGIDREEAKNILAAFHQLEKPVYIHCHRGTQRGPTAAMLILKQYFEASQEKTLALMADIGTSKSYTGLYKSVAEFKSLTKQEIEAVKAIPETAKVHEFADRMAKIDRIWERLKGIQKGKWKKIDQTTELDASHEVLLLREQFTELIRFNKKSELTAGLKHTEELLIKLEEIVLRAYIPQRDVLYKKVRQSCMDCHKKYRN